MTKEMEFLVYNCARLTLHGTGTVGSTLVLP